MSFVTPFMQISDISDYIETSAWLEEISVLCEHAVTDDATSVILRFEVRVRKTYKYLIQLSLHIISLVCLFCQTVKGIKAM